MKFLERAIPQTRQLVPWPKRSKKILLFVLVMILAQLPEAPKLFAQTQSWYDKNPPTSEEQRMLDLDRAIHTNLQLPKEKQDPNLASFLDEFCRLLTQYVREGCKEALSGAWEIEQYGDIISISWAFLPATPSIKKKYSSASSI